MSRTFSRSRRSLLKKTFSVLTAAAILPLLPRRAFAAEGKKALIVFYSWSGNTRALAGLIRQHLNADMSEVLPVTPYPSGYNDCVALAQKEKNENVFPALRPLPMDVSAYDVILAGSPNWWGTWAGPMRTFLHDNDFKGKTVLPFATHGGGGWQSMPADIAGLCPGARIGEGLSVYGSDAARSSAQVERWLRQAELI